jgi:hypothetical protein
LQPLGSKKSFFVEYWLVKKCSQVKARECISVKAYQGVWDGAAGGKENPLVGDTQKISGVVASHRRVASGNLGWAWVFLPPFG